MMRYSVETRDRIFVRGYQFLPFAKNMGKNIGRNISDNVNGKYNQMHLKIADALALAADALKNSSKRVIQKTAEATGS